MDDYISNIKKEWYSVREQYGADTCTHLPVLVISSGSPADAEHITREVVRFAYAERILVKVNAGQKDYLFFSASYTRQDDSCFPAVQELYQLVMDAAGYYGSYRGILLIDVSEWAGHYQEKYFDIFLSYLADLRQDGLAPFFYTDCTGPGSEMQTLSTVVSSYFSSIQLRFEAADLYAYAASLLEKAGILLSAGGSHYLECFIREASRSELFHGMESVRHVCDGIAHKPRTGRRIISLEEQDLKEIIAALGYGDIYDRPVKTIGFR